MKGCRGDTELEEQAFRDEIFSQLPASQCQLNLPPHLPCGMEVSQHHALATHRISVESPKEALETLQTPRSFREPP